MERTGVRLLVAGALVVAGCRGNITVGEVEVSVAPLSGSQGQTITLFVTGVGTDFGEESGIVVDPTVSIVEEDTGIVVVSSYVDNPHRARVALRISADAAVTGGSVPARTLRIETSGRTFDFPFHVAGASTLPVVALEPDAGFAGVNGQVIAVTAVDGSMLFEEGETVITFPEDSGVHVDGTGAWATDGFEVTVSIDEAAVPQTVPVTVTTGLDVATHPFEILPSEAGPRLDIYPNEVRRGATHDLSLVVEGMTLDPADLSAESLSFPYYPAIDVESVEYVDTPEMRSAWARITIEAGAPITTCRAVLRSGGQEAQGELHVLPATGTEPFLRLFPSVIQRGVSGQEMQIQGFYTHFGEDSELAIVPGYGIEVELFSVDAHDPERALAIVSVDSEAELDSHVATVTTGSEEASAVLTVVDPTALTVGVTPASAEQGTGGLVLVLDVSGADLTTAVDVVVAFAAESGICIESVSLISDTEIEVVVDVDQLAPTGGALLTLTVDGETATAPFSVAPSMDVPGFDVVPEFLSVPSRDVGLVLVGHATGWTGDEELTFSSPSIEVVDFTVTSATRAVATVRVPAWIDRRRVVARVASGAGIAGAWLTVLASEYRAVTLSTPAEIEAGQKARLFTAAGTGTGFMDGLTTAFVAPGSGLRVSRVSVSGPDIALVEMDASTDAAPGLYALTLGTGGEMGLATLSVVASSSPPTALLQPTSAVEDSVWTSALVIDGTGTGFDTTTELNSAVRKGEYDAWLGLDTPRYAVRDDETIEVDLRPSPDLVGHTFPLEVRTDLEVVRACISVVAAPSDPYPEIASEDLALRPSDSRTVRIWGRGPGIDFLTDTPTIAVVGGGIAITGESWDDRYIDLDIEVEADAVEDVELSVRGAAYDWTIVLPVLPPPPSVALTGSPTLRAGTRDGTIGIEGTGLVLDDTVLGAASAGRVLFVDSVTATSESTAVLGYDVAVKESASSAKLYVLPQPTPWAVPLPLTFAAADVTGLIPPVHVLETIPSTGPDYLGFTPSSGGRLGLWTVLDGGTAGVDWEVLASDGIRVTGRGGGRATALLGLAASRAYVGVGDGSMSGTRYWVGIDAVLTSALHEELEVNDTILSAEGIDGPGGRPFLGSINAPCDVDVLSLSGESNPHCYEIVSTRWMAGTFTSPFVELTLMDGTGTPVAPLVEAVGPGHMDPILCVSTSAGEYLLVRSLCSTSGVYLLQPRWPLVISELDHTVSFVEISGPPGFDLTGYVLQVVNASTGTVAGTVSLAVLGSVPSDGLIVVASPGAVSGADLESAVLDLMTVPYAVRVGHAGRLTFDRVQVGSSTTVYGEGAVLSPTSMPAGRIFGLDTNDNAADFHKLVAGTPGLENALPAP